MKQTRLETTVHTGHRIRLRITVRKVFDRGSGSRTQITIYSGQESSHIQQRCDGRVLCRVHMWPLRFAGNRARAPGRLCACGVRARRLSLFPSAFPVVVTRAGPEAQPLMVARVRRCASRLSLGVGDATVMRCAVCRSALPSYPSCRSPSCAAYAHTHTHTNPPCDPRG